ncbi:putative ferric-chelate reductase 1 homolog [Dermacentor andersoni]|uniref:putative ferric-chelate reductase 1 homolog n=1 Tax=Dermacentor andersoni TaxID=34620 RepID=UPI002155301E|nr:putative ferric-chelate reductase 1 homolog [Dermacentor andersoni]
MKMAALLLVVLLVAAVARAFPDGAPVGACDSFMPRHGTTAALPNPTTPYAVVQSKAHYNPGDIVTVTVTTSGPSFKGFIVQGFNPQTREVIGEFLGGPGTHVIPQCSAITHENNRNKKAATLNWKAPLNSGPVMFRATVVKSFTEFYANLLSQSAGY